MNRSLETDRDMYVGFPRDRTVDGQSANPDRTDGLLAFRGLASKRTKATDP